MAMQNDLKNYLIKFANNIVKESVTYIYQLSFIGILI